MRSNRFVACLGVLLLAGCSGETRGPQPQSLPDDVFADAPWEKAWEKGEADTWREGTVVDLPPGSALHAEALTPVADALVELLVPAPKGHVLPTEIVASARSGPDGRFRVGPAPPDAWLLRVTQPGRATAWIGAGEGAAALAAAEPLPGACNRVALRKAFDLHGRVADQRGQPVSGVRLVATSMAYREDLKSGEDGTFIARAPRGPIHFEVEDVRFAALPTTVVVTLEGPPPSAEIRVRENPPLHGRVVGGPERRPVAGALVVCLDDVSVRTRTDADGRFEIPVASGGRVAAAAGGYGWRSCEAPKAGEAEIRILPVPPVSGVVVDAEGRPVEGARLTAVVPNYDGMFERVAGPLSGPGGKFTITWLPRAPRGVDTPPRIVATRRGMGESAIMDVTDEARAAGLRLTLSGVRELRGRAVTGGGGPVTHAMVTATWGHWDVAATPTEVAVLGLAESQPTLTGTDGTWRIRGVPVGLHAKVECAWRGFVKELMLEGPVATKSLDFEFTGGATIAGRVAAPGGGPAEGPVRVSAQLVNVEGQTGQREVTAAADGAFRFDDLPPGSYQIRAEGEKYDLASGGVYETGNTSVTVTMQRSAKLSIKLEFDGGVAPDVSLLMTMTPESKRSQPFSFRLAAGRGGEPVVLTKLDPGVWKLTGAGDVWRASLDRIELADGDSKEIALRVARTIRLAAKVLGSDGKPVARQLIVVTPEDPAAGAPQPAVTGADGVADVTGLAPGRWSARCEHEGDVPFETPFTVQAGANPTLEMRAPAGGTIEVHAATGEGEPIADAVVALSAPDGVAVHAWGPGAQGLSSRFRLDAEGRVTIRGVRPGRVAVVVSVGGRNQKPSEVDVRPGAKVTIDVKLGGN